MEQTNKKLGLLSEKINSGKKIKVAILGLGSVGNYLLNFLLDLADEKLEIIVAGRNKDKLIQDTNIAKVASSIRGTLKSTITIKQLDMNNIEEISNFFAEEKPDFAINSTRAYSGIKYGAISWHNIRAYGIWSPLAISIIKNIMTAHKNANSNSIIINTSYSDSVNAWLKSAGLNYPDFGSGNLNHLTPRIKFAVKELMGLKETDLVDVTISTSHFHDVVISKEGQTEGLNPLLRVLVNGEIVNVDEEKVYKMCAISMPTDQKRNMMNASSNFEIIVKILNALRQKKSEIFHSPGAFGNIGGYPIEINGANTSVNYFEKYFTYEDMKSHNLKSIYLDGVENVENGNLYYTDELLEKVKNVFGVTLPKEVPFQNIENVANQIIETIIKPNI